MRLLTTIRSLFSKRKAVVKPFASILDSVLWDTDISNWTEETLVAEQRQAIADFHRTESKLDELFARVMEEAEDSNASIESKFHLTNLVVTGRAYDKGTVAYQDFSLLTATRNALVHFKSKEYFSTVEGRPVVFNPAAVVDKLRSKNILHESFPGEEWNLHISAGDTVLVSAEPVSQGPLGDGSYKFSADARASWIYLIGTKAVAEWACKTAAEMALDLIEKVPGSNWKNHMEGHLREAFSGAQ